MITDEAVVAAVSPHPAVERIELVGSRAEGRETRWSDWDFGVRARDFPAIAEALPGLLAPLEALVEQWDRLSEHQCWMLILRGPVKVDLIFAEEPHDKEPPWEPVLAPLGVEACPASVAEAVSAYRKARDRAEQRFGLRVSRELENAVAPAL